MESITFECEVITPMFLAGADGVTPELRAPSIKGALRFWWRAMNGHLSLKELKEQEGKIFGNTASRSQVIIRVHQKDLQSADSEMVPHKPFMKRPAFLPNQQFEVTLMLSKSKDLSIEQLKNLFLLTCYLGGFGKRSRRGMGSVNIIKCDAQNWKLTPITIEYIHSLLHSLSKHFVLTNGSIYNSYSGRMELYPWIKQIQLGEPNSRILRVISDTTNEVHKRGSYAYEPSLGHAFKGRFASPIFVSTVFGSLKPIITTLNTVPDRGRNDIDRTMQENFKNQILNL